MRIIQALVVVSLISLAACKDDVGNYEKIGKFTVKLNGDSLEFISVFDKAADRSGIRKMTPVGVDLILIDGYAGDKDGEPDLPVISLSLQSGITNKTMSLMFVQVFDKDYQTALTSQGPIGNHQMQNLEIGEDGSISFDFTADLVRITTQEEKIVEGAAGAHIEGHFSGTIPASELEE